MLPSDSPAVLTVRQAQDLDRLALDVLQIPGRELMERAGKNCADEIWERFQPRRVLLACGNGNNGGDGFVIARHLNQLGSQCTVWIVAPEKTFSPDAELNRQRWLALGGTTVQGEQIAMAVDPLGYEVVVDCLLGTGFQTAGPLREPLAGAIRWLNSLRGIKVAIDVPSGLNADTGRPAEPTFQADWTLTMVLPKAGFSNSLAAMWLGHVVPIDLGIPNAIIALAGRRSPNPGEEDRGGTDRLALPDPSPSSVGAPKERDSRGR